MAYILRSRHSHELCEIVIPVNEQSFPSSPSTASTMHGFITTPSARLPFRSLVRPSICRVKQGSNVFFRAPVISTMSAQRMSGDVEESASEDDDATFGEPGRVFGMQMPDLTDSDKAFLNAAVSNEDFMARMAQLAHRIDEARKRSNVAEGRTGPDDYMDSLKRAPPDLSKEDFPSTGPMPAEDYLNRLKRPPPDLSSHDSTSTGSAPADDYMDSLKRPPPKLDDKQYESRNTNDGEEYMQQLTRKSTEQTQRKESPSPPRPKPVDESVRKVQDLQAHLRSQAGADAADLLPDTVPDAAALDAQIAELQETLRKAAGESDEDVEAPTAQQAHPADTGALEAQITAMEAELQAATGEERDDGEVGEVDKRIDFLEEYLSKLKKEEEQQVMKERIGGAVDDLARSTETGPKFEGLENAPGELTEQEKIEAFEAIRRKAMMRTQQKQDEFADPLAKPLPTGKSKEQQEDVDVDLEKGAGMSEADFVISDLDAEVKTYLFDAKQLLNEHETRMRALLAKLRDL